MCVAPQPHKMPEEKRPRSEGRRQQGQHESHRQVLALPVQKGDSGFELLGVEQDVHVRVRVASVGVEAPPRVPPAHAFLEVSHTHTHDHTQKKTNLR